MNGEKGTSGNWFFDLLTLFSPDLNRIRVTGAPQEMITQTAREAFVISATAGLTLGPLGLVTMVPELVSVTKIQLNLVYKIAKYHGAAIDMDRKVLLLIFGEALGLTVARSLARRAGRHAVVRALETRLARQLARSIGERIVAKAVEKSVIRWLPILAAPVLGAFSRSMTIKIGRQAERMFSQQRLS